jgi:hypothetical protein
MKTEGRLYSSTERGAGSGDGKRLLGASPGTTGTSPPPPTAGPRGRREACRHHGERATGRQSLQMAHTASTPGSTHHGKPRAIQSWDGAGRGLAADKHGVIGGEIELLDTRTCVGRRRQRFFVNESRQQGEISSARLGVGGMRGQGSGTVLSPSSGGEDPP